MVEDFHGGIFNYFLGFKLHYSYFKLLLNVYKALLLKEAIWNMIGTSNIKLTCVLVIVLTYHQVAFFNWAVFEVVSCTRMASVDGYHKSQKPYYSIDRIDFSYALSEDQF